MDSELQHIADKVRSGRRIAAAEAFALWRGAPLWLLGELADGRKRAVSGDKVYYNRNFHIEPTNRCVFNCRFCSYRRPKGDPEAWDYSMEEIEAIARAHAGQGMTEVHIVGGVHPDHDLDYYVEMIRRVKAILPEATVKAFTAIELSYMIRRAGLSLEEGLRRLREAGMEAIPGGGAEIFDEDIRARICPDKGSTAEWLAVHEAAHRLGIKTNATILYGHIEGVEHRIDHLDRLRALQDRTGGFNAFIPLKYRNYGNAMSEVGDRGSADAGHEPHLSGQHPPRQGLLGDVRQGDHRTGARLRGRRHRRYDRRYDENLLHGGGRRPASPHDGRRDADNRPPRGAAGGRTRHAVQRTLILP